MRGRVGERGFTLVEVVVALLIFSLVVGAALAVYQQAMLSWHREEARVDVQENLRIGLDRMSRELRTAVELYEANNDSIRFKSADGKTVRYYHRNDVGQLMREVDGGHNPVASYVTALNLTYYDADHNPVQNPESVRLVRIILTGRKGGGPEVTMSTSVKIRALG